MQGREDDGKAMKQKVTQIWSRIKLDLQNNRIGILVVILYFAFFMLLFREVCPMLIVTGLPCPACGLTRAGLLVLRGDFAGAFRMHPFIYVWIAFAGYLGYNRYVRGRKMPWGLQLLVIIILAMVVYYGYRMLCFFPDREPMAWSGHRALLDIRGFLE